MTPNTLHADLKVRYLPALRIAVRSAVARYWRLALAAVAGVLLVSVTYSYLTAHRHEQQLETRIAAREKDIASRDLTIHMLATTLDSLQTVAMHFSHALDSVLVENARLQVAMMKMPRPHGKTLTDTVYVNSYIDTLTAANTSCQGALGIADSTAHAWESTAQTCEVLVSEQKAQIDSLKSQEKDLKTEVKQTKGKRWYQKVLGTTVKVGIGVGAFMLGHAIR